MGFSRCEVGHKYRFVYNHIHRVTSILLYSLASKYCKSSIQNQTEFSLYENTFKFFGFGEIYSYDSDQRV
jgi:hypothetical protein